MHKRVEPDTSFVQHLIKQFPHCDERVLHAPSECEYCDKHPVWQALRISWGIAFTGYVPDDKELPDPATNARGLDKVSRWAGNRPKPVEPVNRSQADGVS